MDQYSLIPNYKDVIPKFFARENSWAVYIGKNREDGKSVTDKLREKGFEVREFDAESTNKVDVLYLNAEPKSALEPVKAADIKKVWLEPGTESQELIEYCQNHKIKTLIYRSLENELANI